MGVARRVHKLEHHLNTLAAWLIFFLGPVAFAAISVLRLFAPAHNRDDFKFGDYLQAVAAGAGLLAISHGVHPAARTREHDNESNERRGRRSDSEDATDDD
jgi:hypothetical protein